VELGFFSEVIDAVSLWVLHIQNQATLAGNIYEILDSTNQGDIVPPELLYVEPDHEDFGSNK